MKITMLGYTGSGKTVYLSALLGLLYGGSVNGFSIQPDRSANSEVYNFFDEINTLYTTGKFPNPTEEDLRILGLSLYKGEHKIIDFDFIDYRGEALVNIAKDSRVDSENMQNLKIAILSSDVSLVFVDAILLKNYPSDLVAREKLGVRAISQILKEANEDAKKINKKIKIIFMLTKTDASIISELEVEDMKKRVVSLYSNVLNCLGYQLGTYKIFDIGTIGKGNVDTIVKINMTKETITNKIKTANYKPYNIVSVIAQAFIEGMSNLDYDVYQLVEALNEKRKKFGIVKNVFDIIFNHSKKRKEIFEIKQEVEEQRRQLENMKENEEELRKIIDSRL